MVRRAAEKNIYISDETGTWRKMDKMEREICKGEEIAPFIGTNKDREVPDLYFKINYEILE